MMDSITLSNFRCFGEKQTARLAPLTLLVGENSTGKTSFLALIRALWDTAYGHRAPDFKEEPYDLGSFFDIVYNNHRDAPSSTFLAGFRASNSHEHGNADHQPLHFETTFERSVNWAIPKTRYFSQGRTYMEEIYDDGRITTLNLGTVRGDWRQTTSQESTFMSNGTPTLDNHLVPLAFHLIPFLEEKFTRNVLPKPIADSPVFSPEDLEAVGNLIHSQLRLVGRPFAGAPVRSKPQRTYDPARTLPDPKGDYIPSYLASLFSQDKSVWEKLQTNLERFGKKSGLFDRLLIEQQGERDGGPFQVRIKGSGGEPRGPDRNLIDVGYGVSQVLPLITEILREDSPNMFLLQQPEVHLHPSAQATLGSLFCEVASKGRQLLIETHSDYILDRIRMDVRDDRSSLTPDDVSVLFFQRTGDDVRINSLRFDPEGNVQGSPQGYRDFFMQETRRSLGL